MLCGANAQDLPAGYVDIGGDQFAHKIVSFRRV
jgi:hypothetical protein